MGFVSTSCRPRTSSLSRSHNLFTSPTRASPASCSTRRPVSKQAAVTDHLFTEKIVLPNGVVDYYEVLGVDDDAGVEEIKKAYRALAKECHPDYLGDEGHNICILLNEAYETLSCPNQRKLYNTELEEALLDAKDDFTGQPLSKWVPSCSPSLAKHTDPAERRALFVDELACVGCKNCMWCAPATFRMEPEHGRARVFGQWLNTEEQLQTAVDSCPVSCIHWVDRDDLPALEYVVQHQINERPNVGIMMSGLGKVPDVWVAAADFMRMKRAAVKEKEMAARYSPAQKEARRRAASSLWQQSSWFVGLSSAIHSAVNGLADAMADMVDGEHLLVGQRKRQTGWDKRGCMQDVEDYQNMAKGYSVPPERALVPVKVLIRAD